MAEDKKIFIKRKLENDPFHMKDVEIIIPFHGEQARVTKLMENIFRTVFTNRYLITLVDDHSENRHFIQKIKDAKIAGVRCFRLDEQRGFGAAVNYALSHPWVFTNHPKKQIPFVCIMQSDAYPEDNQWLSELGATLDQLKGEGVKMVAPLTDNPMSDMAELKSPKGSVKKDLILKNGFLPMYCVLCHRELFNRVGMLQEFPYAGCEAREFAQRMNKNGFQQAICGKSWVHHDGGATLEKYANNKRVQKILRNVEEQFFPGEKAQP